MPRTSSSRYSQRTVRRRYNQTVPTDRESAEVPLGGELIRQEALLDKLFATLPEAIVVLDTDDRILRVNPEFTRIFGYAEEEVLGRPINELVVPEELCAEVEEYTRRGTRGEILSVETMRKRKDGSRVPVSIVGVPVSVAGSRISEYVIYRDITERKRAEQRLRQSEAYLAEAQRLSQTGSWAWSPDTDVRYWSEECYRVLGFDPHDGLPSTEELIQRIHPDDQLAFRESTKRAKHNKLDEGVNYRIVHPGGAVRDIHSIGHPVFSPSGDLMEYTGTVIDVTERKRAEQELQQLVDLVPQLIVVLDSGGKRIHTNRVFREYTGLTPEELRSGNEIGLIHRDDVEGMRAARDRGISAGEPFELDARWRGKDGIYRWFLARYNPLVEEGRARRWYVTATEIESRKQEEERIRQENVRLEERTRIAQKLHDTLLQTFQSASLHLGAAVLRVAQDSPVKNQLDRILEIMRQGIVEGRSAIQGLRSPGSQTSDLVGTLSRIQDELKVQPDIDFRVTVTGRQRQLPREIQDEICRIGREALVNAFCHSGAKRIELELEYSDNKLYVRIRDNGCGIDPQILEKGCDGHWGLAGMRERATRIGGLLEILSSATAGTEVQLSISSGTGLELSSSHHSSE